MTTIRVRLDTRPGIIDPLDPDQLQWWYPTLGPTASLLLPILVQRCSTHDGVVDLDEIGFRLGCPGHGVITKALIRFERFYVGARDDDGTLVLRRYLPHVRSWQLSHAPEWWVRGYGARFGFPKSFDPDGALLAALA